MPHPLSATATAPLHGFRMPTALGQSSQRESIADEVFPQVILPGTIKPSNHRPAGRRHDELWRL